MSETRREGRKNKLKRIWQNYSYSLDQFVLVKTKVNDWNETRGKTSTTKLTLVSSEYRMIFNASHLLVSSCWWWWSWCLQLILDLNLIIASAILSILYAFSIIRFHLLFLPSFLFSRPTNFRSIHDAQWRERIVTIWIFFFDENLNTHNENEWWRWLLDLIVSLGLFDIH